MTLGCRSTVFTLLLALGLTGAVGAATPTPGPAGTSPPSPAPATPAPSPSTPAPISAATLRADQDYLDGSAAERAGDLARAERSYREGEELDPTLAGNYFAAADLAIRAKRFGDAKIQLQRLVARLPTEPYAHYYLALVQHALGDDAAAVADLNAELALRPTFQPARTTRASFVAAAQRARTLDARVRAAGPDEARRLSLAFAAPRPTVPSRAPARLPHIVPLTAAASTTPAPAAVLPPPAEPALVAIAPSPAVLARIDAELAGLTTLYTTTSAGAGATPLLGVALGESRTGATVRALADAHAAAVATPLDPRVRYVYGLLLFRAKDPNAVAELARTTRITDAPAGATPFLALARAAIVPDAAHAADSASRPLVTP